MTTSPGPVPELPGGAPAEGEPDSHVTRLFLGVLTDVRLTAPDTRQAAAYRERARAWLARSVPAAAEPRCVHATTKSAVFRAATADGDRAVKVFDDLPAFRRELLNARLLRHDASCVRLLAWNRAEAVLEYEWLPEVGLPARPEDYLRHLARVHTAAHRLPHSVTAIVRSLAERAPATVARGTGTGMPGCAVLDLKAGHCGRRADGRGLVQLDLESLVFGADVLLDVAGAASMLGLAADRQAWHGCLRAYQEESRAHGIHWRWEQLAGLPLTGRPEHGPADSPVPSAAEVPL
ncbi:hypothetical protein AB0C61_20555 [Streptomyces sp. NPDC048680]|uniref:hypothetical protein n=1 Tax=Streptomyces sp. NPDC048680 TaxID=3155492 RepID=UPI003427BCD7